MGLRSFLGITALALVGCTEQPPPQADPHATPDAVFEAYDDAVAEEDWGVAWELTDPDQRQGLIGLSAVAAQSAAKSEPERKSLLDLQQEHRVRLFENGRLVIDADLRTVPSQRELFLALMKAAGKEVSVLRVEDLRKVRIDGARATGRCQARVRSSEETRTLGFARVDGRWYVSETWIQPAPVPSRRRRARYNRETGYWSYVNDKGTTVIVESLDQVPPEYRPQ